MHHQHMVHAELFHAVQSIIHTGQCFGIHVLNRGFLAMVRGGPAVHECGARVKQNHHGKSIMLVREFHHTLDHRLMTQVHAIKCAQCHHGLLIVTERGPFNRTFGVRGQVRDIHQCAVPFIRAMLFMQYRRCCARPVSSCTFHRVYFTRGGIR